jgi:hypothetical protein
MIHYGHIGKVDNVHETSDGCHQQFDLGFDMNKTENLRELAFFCSPKVIDPSSMEGLDGLAGSIVIRSIIKCYGKQLC